MQVRWHGAAAVGVFLFCLIIGLWIARHKPISNDEFYSLVSSTHNTSYLQMLSGKVPEGNNSPLFYLLQKSLNYPIPQPWLEGHWEIKFEEPKIFLRLLPIACMSLSIAIILYFFSLRYSWGTAALSLSVYACSYMLWVYWAEARPYALLVALTTIQTVLLCELLMHRRKHWQAWALAGVHILLALTSILSAGQIVAASMCMWIFGKERRWMWYVCGSAIPLILIGFYFQMAPKYNFWFNLTPEQLIRDSISRERLYILGIGLAVFGLSALQALKQYMSRVFEEMRMVAPFLFYIVLTLLSAMSVLWMFWLKQSSVNDGFPVSNRYFIQLMPVGIVGTTLVCVYLWRSFSFSRWIQFGLALSLAALLVPRIKIPMHAIHSILGN